MKSTNKTINYLTVYLSMANNKNRNNKCCKSNIYMALNRKYKEIKQLLYYLILYYSSGYI